MQLDCILLAVQLLANFGIGKLLLHNCYAQHTEYLYEILPLK